MIRFGDESILYEMLAGEPPFTGPTVQAIIAKRLAEQPPQIRTVRPAIPESLGRAISRALDVVGAFVGADGQRRGFIGRQP